MEPRTKKGLIIGGSIAAIVLAGAAVTTGIVLSATSSDELSGPVTTAAFSDAVSSSALRQDKWMGIDFDDATGTYDGTLVKNSYYTPVNNEEEMVDVVKSSDGVGYMSYTTLMLDPELKTLSVSEDQGDTWISADSDGIPTAAPLDMVFKAPVPVTNLVNDFLPSTYDGSTPLSFELLNVDGTTYGDWVRDNYAFDFAMSLIFFAWVAESADAHDAIGASYGVQNTDYSVSKADFDTWIKTVFADEAWGIVDASGNIDFHGMATGTYELNIDGTGTDELIVNIAIDSLSEAYGINILQNLNNHGSGAAWYMDSQHTAPEWADGDGDGDMTDFTFTDPGEYNGSTNSGYWGAFIGTQSRAAEQDGDEAFGGWGFDWDTYAASGATTGDATDSENVKYNYDVTSTTDNIPLATTIGNDKIVFYTTQDAYFVGDDGVEYTPDGLTREGAKDLFQNGLSYNELVAKGELLYSAK